MNSGSTPTRLRAIPLGVLVLVAWLVLLVAPVAAATAGSTGLSDPTVTPRSGTMSTTIAFSIAYRNGEGSGTPTITSVALAFLAFGKRRRNEAPPASDELSLAAASPYAFPTAWDVAAPRAIPAASLPPVPVFDPGSGGTDVNLPRWRRPSLLAARKSDPVRDAATGLRLTFGGAPADAAGTERRRIRYRIIRLLDRPDELRGLEIGTLGEGDEVAILEQYGMYRRVLTPDGRQGWLHRMTLGDLVPDGAPEAEPEVDGGVMLAFLAARARG